MIIVFVSYTVNLPVGFCSAQAQQFVITVSFPKFKLQKRAIFDFSMKTFVFYLIFQKNCYPILRGMGDEPI